MLPAPIAVEFLRRCREQGLVLLGMDAFIIHPGPQVQPTLTYSPDYSRSDLPYIPHDERYELAFKLLALPEVQHLYFESVFDTRDEQGRWPSPPKS